MGEPFRIFSSSVASYAKDAAREGFRETLFGYLNDYANQLDFGSPLSRVLHNIYANAIFR